MRIPLLLVVPFPVRAIQDRRPKIDVIDPVIALRETEIGLEIAVLGAQVHPPDVFPHVIGKAIVPRSRCIDSFGPFLGNPRVVPGFVE